jgi:probable selenium-dependent hydroxylase accessory protein YqeC
MDIVRTLGADDGLLAVVGAGGKKTTLYALADRLDRAIVTATVRIPIFDEQVSRVAVAADPVAALPEASPADFPLGLVPEQERDDRYRGYDSERVDALAAAHDGPTLVKADGARTRWLKAPDEREPQVPATTDTVVPIASARVVGEALTGERVHRPERVASVAGLEVGDELRPEHVARVLASERGGLKGVPDGATVVPLVNMVDDAALETAASEIARETLSRADVASTRLPLVVLARMNADEPLVGVVEREDD